MTIESGKTYRTVLNSNKRKKKVWQNIKKILSPNNLYIRLGKRIFISPLFILLAIAAYFGEYIDLFLVSYFSALLHEIGHIYMANKLGIKVERVEFQPFGICGRLGVDFIKNPKKEIAIAAIGPIISGLISLCLYLFLTSQLAIELHMGKYVWHILDYAYWINLALFLLNILPVLPLDGGRIMKAVLSEFMGVIRAYNMAIRFSRVAITIIIGLSTLLLLTSNYNFSIILIAVFLLGSLSAEQKNISLVSLKEILYHKNKLKYSGLCSSVRIAALDTVPARSFLRMMSSHKYYIIDVINSDGKIIKSVTESQILSALIDKSIRLTMGEI